jgi:hypothetical protein
MQKYHGWKKKLMNSIDAILDEYNAGKLTKEQLQTLLVSPSKMLKRLDK